MSHLLWVRHKTISLHFSSTCKNVKDLLLFNNILRDMACELGQKYGFFLIPQIHILKLRYTEFIHFDPVPSSLNSLKRMSMFYHLQTFASPLICPDMDSLLLF